MYVKVKVVANARKEKIEKIGDNRYKIDIKEPAEQNLANNRIIEIISDLYKVKRNNVKIFSGHHSPSKLLSVHMPE